jgi:PRTRC genetic system ThiF family protein
MAKKAVKNIKSIEQVYSLAGFPPAKTVLVVGCGGTGGHLVPHLARYIKVVNERDPRATSLILADGDIVEEKNLKRQHFIEADISKNKAMVMAERYSSAFGLEIRAIPSDLESDKQIDEALNFYPLPSDYSYLVIGCVDNNASRKIIHKWLNSDGYNAKFWIDSGNEEKAGQVICGYSPAIRGYYMCVKAGPKNKIKSGDFSLPCVIDHYPELGNDSSSAFNSQLSCADRAISAPQNMQVNVSAATIIMNYARKIIDCEALRSHGVEFSIDNVYNTKLNIEENLSKVSDERKRYWEK